MDGNMMVCTGFYSLATSNASASLISHIPQDANGVYMARAMLIRAVGNNANFTLDGTTPTTGATGGMPINTTDTGPLWIGNLANLERFKAIAVTGSGSIAVLFFN